MLRSAQPAGFRSRLPAVVLAITLLLTGLTAYYLATTAAARDRLRFQNLVDKTEVEIKERMETYVALLSATSGLFAAVETVSRGQFRTFVNGLDLPRRYPGIQGIGFSARIRPKGKAALTRAMRRQGLGAFAIRPLGDRAEYHAIIYLEPLDRRNEAAIGYDMSTEPRHRAAMERARDTGRPAASGKVTLVQEIDPKKQAGFLIYLPLYRRGARLDTIEARRAALAGYVYSPFRADDLMNGILGAGTPGIGFQIFADTRPTPESLLHRSDPGASDGVSASQVQTTEQCRAHRPADVSPRPEPAAPWPAYIPSPHLGSVPASMCRDRREGSPHAGGGHVVGLAESAVNVTLVVTAIPIADMGILQSVLDDKPMTNPVTPTFFMNLALSAAVAYTAFYRHERALYVGRRES